MSLINLLPISLKDLTKDATKAPNVEEAVLKECGKIATNPGMVNRLPPKNVSWEKTSSKSIVIAGVTLPKRVERFIHLMLAVRT